MDLQARRLKLHEELCEILGSRNVYFQPPESVRLKYPCIIYSRSTGDVQHADNRPYIINIRYELTLISKDPDSEYITKIQEHFPTCRLDRHFTSDNLNHETFDLYY